MRQCPGAVALAANVVQEGAMLRTGRASAGRTGGKRGQVRSHTRPEA